MCIRDSVGAGRAVGILDVDFGIRQFVSNLGERSRFVDSIDHQHVALDDKGSVFLEDSASPGGVADHHPYDAVIHGVADGDGLDVDLGVAERVTDPGEGPWSICQKYGKLFSYLHMLLY